MCELIESFQYEILKRLKEMTSVVVFEYEDVKFIYDKSFKTSDEFKDLCDEYKEKFSKVYEQY